MKILDCRNFESALVSLSAILEVEPGVLATKLRSQEFVERDVPFEKFLWQTIVGRRLQFDGIHWFHATRTRSPWSFLSRGILPLHDMLEEIWATVFELIGDRLPPVAKEEFRRSVESGSGHDGAEAYAWKLQQKSDWGPHALLVREVAFNTRGTNRHDYLGSPEIIEDIGKCLASWHGFGLGFAAASRPCIVTFLGGNDRDYALPEALRYLWGKIQNSNNPNPWSTCFAGEGKPIPPERVVRIEVDPTQ